MSALEACHAAVSMENRIKKEMIVAYVEEQLKEQMSHIETLLATKSEVQKTKELEDSTAKKTKALEERIVAAESVVAKAVKPPGIEG